MKNIQLLESERKIIDQSITQILDLALRSDITREKYEDILTNVLVEGYTNGYSDGYIDGGEDACADEHGDTLHIERVRCRF